MLTRLMCSSFTDGAAAVVLAGPSVPAPAPAPRSSPRWHVGERRIDYHERMAETAAAAWDAAGVGPERHRPGRTARRHDAEEISPSNRWDSSAGEAGPATAAGDTASAAQA